MAYNELFTKALVPEKLQHVEEVKLDQSEKTPDIYRKSFRTVSRSTIRKIIYRL